MVILKNGEKQFGLSWLWSMIARQIMEAQYEAGIMRKSSFAIRSVDLLYLLSGILPKPIHILAVQATTEVPLSGSLRLLTGMTGASAVR